MDMEADKITKARETLKPDSPKRSSVMLKLQKLQSRKSQLQDEDEDPRTKDM